MNEAQFRAMEKNLKAAVHAFPNCHIANCNCNSKNGKWRKGCHCMCHFKTMDEIKGKGNWKLEDVSKQAKVGIE